MFVELALTSSSDPSDGSVQLWNLHTGSSLTSFKQNINPLNSLALINNPRNLGSLFLSAQADKGMMHVYSYQKDQVNQKFPLPEKIIALTTSTRGTYAVGGTESGRLYIWEVATGILHRSFDAHYKKITVLRFSSDDTVLFSGSEDAVVHVWMLHSLLDDSQQESPAPHYSWTDHSLAITDIQCGIGKFHGTRVLTSSLDHTVKFWDLSTGTQLTTFLFPTKITSLALDPAERFFLASSGTPSASYSAATSTEPDYLIYQALLFKSKFTAQGYTTIESVDGDSGLEQVGLGGAKKTGGKGTGGGDLIFRGHHAPITKLTLNFDGSALVSGDSKGQLMVWDVVSRQMIREVKCHKGSVSSIHTFFQPADLFTNTTLSEKPKLSPCSIFKRIPQARFGEAGPEVKGDGHSIADDVVILVPKAESKVSVEAELEGSSEGQLLKATRRAVTSLSSSTSAGDAVSLSEYQELERRLKEAEDKLAAAQINSAPAPPPISHAEIDSLMSSLQPEGAGSTRKKRRNA